MPQNPEGPWSDPIPVAQNGIDPSIMFDDDGRVYFHSSSTGDQGHGIYQCEIDIETGKILTESRLIWKGTGGAYPEAPHLYTINGQYYLMIAEGGTEYGHMETVARSNHPYGPIVLQIQAFPEKFVASVQSPQSETIEMGWGKTHLLSTEVAGGFTGVFVTMYATSETGQSAPASFDWFDYEPIIISS
ncbi:beta-xylosidase [Fontibacillus solani]|uniref:Beta-xylosidase n=1 Tax=Fontibacillus solani TaxID=1572857 RepID=A0A7W3XRJ2_9BACL|nr:family 43 glycosylhydrolase [Fontibacillus solani]MBA9085536.1 beta-xylosidase [Fontibacillus solani]